MTVLTEKYRNILTAELLKAGGTPDDATEYRRRLYGSHLACPNCFLTRSADGQARMQPLVQDVVTGAGVTVWLCPHCQTQFKLPTMA